MKLVFYFVHCLLLWSFFSDAEETTRLKPLVFSYVSHPIIELQLKPRISEAYRKLGYKVRFVNMQSDRFIQQFESGAVDGDVARLGQLTSVLPSMLLVYQFDQLNLTLECRPGLSCTEADLEDPKNLLFIPAQNQVFRMLQLNYKAQVYTVRDWSQLIDLYNEGKIDRFFWLEGNRLKTGQLPQTNSLLIKTPELKLYHVLHNSNAELAPLVKAELEKTRQKRASADSKTEDKNTTTK
ncbi:hypothetical protein [Rheinheimera sp.]|jgi:hypothetical protein|uniref:hypothetical protein n=1 Tax=Rheinheimera sp. TaxID=1869214 RepID=UPI002604E95B|nr:hypothetical protein [Rheinheimera sp.]MCA1928412.1 hypothetical protein [Rheinheimera sp.]